MTLRKSAPYAKARWSALMAVLALLLLVLAQAAWAVLAPSKFEGNDGNLAVDTSGNTDWANVSGLHSGVDLTSGTGDNSFGQGTKEDNAAVTVVSGSIPPNKNDLVRFYEASETVSGKTFVYLAWERAVNIGNANLDFEINQSASSGLGVPGPHTITRTPGDILVTYDFGGSGTPTLGLLRWVTGAHTPDLSAYGFASNACFSANSFPCWGDQKTLNSGNSEGAVNTVAVTDPLAPNAGRNLPIGTFGEASINLSDAGVFTPGTCGSFGSTFLKSRSSSSFTAELKDFIAPTPVLITNCGSITIRKVTQNGDGSFGFTSGGSPTTLTSSFSLSNGGSHTDSSVLPGSYNVSESTKPAGWSLVGIDCSATTGTGTSATVDGSDPTKVNITMASGGAVDCTYTNHVNIQPSLATDLSADSILNTATVTDTATLSGATDDASGAITISVYRGTGSGACVAANLVDSKTASPVTAGNGDYTATFGPLAAGHYEFQAIIAADANNVTASSSCGSEPLTVQNQPSASTAQRLLPNDTFTLSGATADAGGTVSFYLFKSADTCSLANKAAAVYTQEDVALVGHDHASTSNTATYVSGSDTWTWLVVYTGDAKNLSVTSDCVESFTIDNG
jgi:hypothetical protein